MQIISTSGLFRNTQIDNETKNIINKKEEAQTLSKVEKIKEQIKNGEYKIDLDKTSKAIVDNYLF